MPKQNTNMSLYIGCIPCKGEESVILDYFGSWGSLINVNLKKRRNGKNCGFGYLKCADLSTYTAILAA